MARALGQERADRDGEPRARDAFTRERPVREVGDRVGTQQHQGVQTARARGLEDAARVETARGGNTAPRVGEPRAPGVELDASGQEAGSEAETEPGGGTS